MMRPAGERGEAGGGRRQVRRCVPRTWARRGHVVCRLRRGRIEKRCDLFCPPFIPSGGPLDSCLASSAPKAYPTTSLSFLPPHTQLSPSRAHPTHPRLAPTALSLPATPTSQSCPAAKTTKRPFLPQTRMALRRWMSTTRRPITNPSRPPLLRRLPGLLTSRGSPPQPSSLSGSF